LFPFANYEFYLFFAYCVSMFILIMNVFKWIK
jgi:heme exporter protein D